MTTGLGYPKKADDAQAHPSVSLLFSDPTGSGIDSGLRVLVQGTATVDDEDLKANAERYVRESGVKLPATKKMNPPKPLRPMFNWYYARLYIKVRPERVFVWPEGDLAEEPTIHDAHLEEVRSGHVEEPAEDHGEAPQGPPAWDQRMDFLAEHDTGVLSWMGPDGFPIAVRVPFTADAVGREISIDAVPAGLPLLEGRACLTVHQPRARFHLAAQHAGPRQPRSAPGTDGAWCPAGSSAGSSCPRAGSPASGTSSRRARASTGPTAGACASGARALGAGSSAGTARGPRSRARACRCRGCSPPSRGGGGRRCRPPSAAPP